MKPLKKKRRSSKKGDAAPVLPGLGLADAEKTAPEILASEGSGVERRMRDVSWLADAFSSVSIDHIDLAYREAGGDPFKAAGILGAHLDDPGEEPAEGCEAIGSGKSFSCTTWKQKQKHVAATGIVANVIGKGYSAGGSGGRRNRHGINLQQDGMKKAYTAEDVEQFLCSMLGDAEIGMDVVRDVLGACEGDIEQALEALLDIVVPSYDQQKDGYHDGCILDIDYSDPKLLNSISSSYTVTSFQVSKKEHVNRPCAGYSNRNHALLFADCSVSLPTESEPLKFALQQQVLASLFNNPNTRTPNCCPNRLNWKKIVEKMESLAPGLEFYSEKSRVTQPTVTGEEDIYREYRGVSNKNWDMMCSYYQKAAVAYSKGDRDHASHLSEKGKFYRDMARTADEKASRDIFEARNKHIKNLITIDLHGQYIKDAMRLLKLHLIQFTYTPSVKLLKVITGHGDAHGKGILKRTVIGFVEKEGIKWSEENPGALILQIDKLQKYNFIENDSDSE